MITLYKVYIDALPRQSNWILLIRFMIHLYMKNFHTLQPYLNCAQTRVFSGQGKLSHVLMLPMYTLS